MNNNTSEFGNSVGFEVHGATYIVVTFVFGLIVLVLAIVVACVRLRMSQSPNFIHILSGFPPYNTGEHSVDNMELGLRNHQNSGDTSFEEYPKFLYSEVKNKGSDSRNFSVCSICLGDYKESDMLRLLPDCGHIYHLACVDPWLRLHTTCPMCRKSSHQPTHSS